MARNRRLAWFRESNWDDEAHRALMELRMLYKHNAQLPLEERVRIALEAIAGYGDARERAQREQLITLITQRQAELDEYVKATMRRTMLDRVMDDAGLGRIASLLGIEQNFDRHVREAVNDDVSRTPY